MNVDEQHCFNVDSTLTSCLGYFIRQETGKTDTAKINITINYFWETLHCRYLTGFWICLGLWIYQRFWVTPGFWIYQVFEYLMVLKIPEFQNQSLRGVSRKRCSENMQQIYMRTPVPKCNFNKVALEFWICFWFWILQGNTVFWIYLNMCE